jgi:hypothetical protein
MNQFIRRKVAAVLTNGSHLRRNVHAEAKIEALGLKMPNPAVPKGNFVNYVQINNFVFLSGHLPQPAEGNLVVGKVGKDLTVEEGKFYAPR